MAGRGFEEIHVGNFSGQLGPKRWPDPESPLKPKPEPWRCNLVALSQKYNLYFAAYKNKIHVTVPRGLKQIIPARSELILELPRSELGFRIGGYIDATVPHAINHLKVGNLGDHEILLMGCDDGDVIAYYTHALLYEVQKPENQTGPTPIAQTRPFFHENVGISAWGLAIHEKSRLIAVGSNNREVMVYAFGCCGWAAQMPVSLQESMAAKQEKVFPDVTLAVDSLQSRMQNFRIVLPLGLGGHNIPCVDFASDAEGNAQIVLAADIIGNLWNLDIWTGEKKLLSKIHQNPSQTNEMGWGVLCLPLKYFRIVGTPNEGLGVVNVQRATVTESASMDLPVHFDISNSILSVKNASPFHHNYQGRRDHFKVSQQNQSLSLNLEEENGRFENDDFDSKVQLILTVLREKHVNPPLTLAEVEFFRRILGVLYKSQTLEPPGSGVQRLEDEVITLLRDSDGLSNPEVIQWIFQEAAKLYDVPNIKTKRTWKEESLVLQAQLQSSPWGALNRDRTSEFSEPPRPPRLGMIYATRRPQSGPFNPIGPPPEILEEKITAHKKFLPDGSAIFHTYNHDIHLCSPCPIVLPSTVCQKILKQSLPRMAPPHLRNFDRLNMLAFIPELSLVVVGSQVGRVALIGLTRMADGYCGYGPVVMCRIEAILPETRHEEKWRPFVQLLGMAVSPLQGSVGRERGGVGGEGLRRWRLLLHYFDGTILSYEIGRGVDFGLVVF